jgi:hypothetical protein
VALLHTPVTAGTVLLNHVDTVNNTASGAAIHRREYFAFSISQEGAVQSRSTPCFDPDSPLSDPSLAHYAQVGRPAGWRVWVLLMSAAPRPQWWHNVMAVSLALSSR